MARKAKKSQQTQKKETVPAVSFFNAQADQLFFLSDSIQPFADIVRNNTCCDGAKKSKKILQHTHLLSRGQLADQTMISNLDIFNTKRGQNL